MDTLQHVVMKKSGRRYKLVPVSTTTSRTDKVVTETKSTSVRNIKTVTTSRQGGQKTINVDKKVITSTSSTESQVVLRQIPDFPRGMIDSTLDVGSLCDIGHGIISRNHIETDTAGEAETNGDEALVFHHNAEVLDKTEFLHRQPFYSLQHEPDHQIHHSLDIRPFCNNVGQLRDDFSTEVSSHHSLQMSASYNDDVKPHSSTDVSSLQISASYNDDDVKPHSSTDVSSLQISASYNDDDVKPHSSTDVSSLQISASYNDDDVKPHSSTDVSSLQISASYNDDDVKPHSSTDVSSPRGKATLESNTSAVHPVHATTTREEEKQNSLKGSHEIASSSAHDSPSNVHHKNYGQHTSELTTRYTRRESADVRPGLVGNRFADSQPTKCDGLADVMKQTSAADGTGAKRPFLDMRSIWDVGQLIVTRKSPRKPITCYKDYIT